MGYSQKSTLAVVIFALACGGENAGADFSTETHEQADIKLLFQDRYSETGRILVYEQGAGIVVQALGRIGEDDHAAVGTLLASGLENAYVALHPELVEAPKILHEIDVRLAAEREERSQFQDTDGALLEESEPMRLLSQSTFNSTGCITLYGSRERWDPTICRYQEGISKICQVACENSGCASQWPTTSKSRTFAWNDSPHIASADGVGISRPSNPVTIDMVGLPFELAPFTWSWYVFGTWPYSGTNVCLRAGGTGKLGITHHRWKAIIQ